MAADESGHNGTISRQALGRTASLGDIYDATTDTFCHMSIFRKQLPADCEAVNKTDTPDSRISYVSVRCLKEMFNKLNVTGELKLSVLAGMCELDGSAKYLSEKKSICKAVENRKHSAVQYQNSDGAFGTVQPPNKEIHFRESVA